MKNEKIVKAFDSVSPSPEAEARMLDRILEGREDRKKVIPFKKLVPIAAAFVLLLGLAVFFVPKGVETVGFPVSDTAVQDDNAVLKINRINTPGGVTANLAVNIRDMTEHEKAFFFSDYTNASAIAMFSIGDNSIFGVEGFIGNAEVKICEEGNSLNCVVVVGPPMAASEINGVRVKAGYYLSEFNRRGEKVETVTYLASFCKDGLQTEIEIWGNYSDREEVKKEFSGLVYSLTSKDLSPFFEIEP